MNALRACTVLGSDDQGLLDPHLRALLTELHDRFEPQRQALLARREERQARFDAGHPPGFLAETQQVRQNEWTIAPIPGDLRTRTVEMTGPVDAKMLLGGLNSAADCYMADFEDASSPTWANMIQGHDNIRQAVAGSLRVERNGEVRTLNPGNTKLWIRVRGLHLNERNVTVDDAPVGAGLFDLAVSLYHTANAIIDKGETPAYYIPKIEHYQEARYWNNLLVALEDTLGLPHGTVKVTVLIETLPAVYQMDEILYELADHIVALNAGRWDYLFSAIKCTRWDAERVLPDRGLLTMQVPWMDAYQRRLVAVCKRRGAQPMGGMSAFIPNRQDRDATEAALQAVRADKEREAGMGCHGTWVAHPDLIGIAHDAFAQTPWDGRTAPLHEESDAFLPHPPEGGASLAAARNNVDVALAYLDAWLQGRGAVAYHNLMEDAATAEICRYQLWQWYHHQVVTNEGTPVDEGFLKDEVAAHGASAAAKALLLDLVLHDQPPAFLTLPAYEVL